MSDMFGHRARQEGQMNEEDGNQELEEWKATLLKRLAEVNTYHAVTDTRSMTAAIYQLKNILRDLIGGL